MNIKIYDDVTKKKKKERKKKERKKISGELM